MPAGCEFYCNNEKCEQYKSGIAITGPWPIGEIDKIVEARNVSKIKEFKEGLLKLKEQGRKYACITYPNVNEVEMVGYRVHKWCAKCKCLYMFDVMLDGGATTFEEALAKSDIPENCAKCNEELSGFENVIENGIECPHCKKQMKSNRWFSNETTEETS